jgi:hypothetical protein
VIITQAQNLHIGAGCAVGSGEPVKSVCDLWFGLLGGEGDEADLGFFCGSG